MAYVFPSLENFTRDKFVEADIDDLLIIDSQQA